MPPKASKKAAGSAASGAAGVKRPPPEDSDDNAGEGSSKAPQNETKRQRDNRLLKEKTDKYYTAAAARDTDPETSQNLPNTAPSDEWVEKLAVHLASESAFIDYMKNPGEPDDLIIPTLWLATVYLPGRTTHYELFREWLDKWWAQSKTRPNGHRFKVIARASEIVSGCILPGQSSIKGTKAPLPANDETTAANRESLFRIQATRSKLMELTRNLTDTQYGLSKALVDIIHKVADSANSGERDDLVKELTSLDTVKTSAKEVLMASQLNATGLKVLDRFLKLVPEHEEFGVLYQLNDGDQFPIFSPTTESHAEPESQSAEDHIKGYDEIAVEIQQTYGIPIDFLAGKTLNDSKAKDVCSIRGSGKRFEALQVSEPLKKDIIVSTGMLTLLEKRCANWLEDLAKNFDETRFMLNFRDFEALTTRPDECANASRGDNYWIRKHNHLEIARDNIAHVRRLVYHLQENGMIVDEHTDTLQLTLRRMYALLALTHGCVAEGAILLTVMDRLLEDLAGTVIGNVDSKLESNRMQHAMSLIHGETAERKSELAINDTKRQEREHKAREVFAEIVRFFHGAVILLFSAASAGKSDQAEDQTKLWYQGIINLSYKCGNTKCSDQLMVKKTPKVGDTSAERWDLSIAVKDARIGFPEERSMVSTNRHTAYPCLYDIVMGRRYHVAYAPFFHYFAHLWHPACRAFRGKGGLLDAMTDIEAAQKDVAMEAPTDDDEEMLLWW